MQRYYYANPIPAFLAESPTSILGTLANHHEHELEEQQRNAWNKQILLLKSWLADMSGTIVFEYRIPRMGRRIDCVLLTGPVVFAIEFKVGADRYDAHSLDQVMDYALDLKNFQEQSHHRTIVPILIATNATDAIPSIRYHNDRVAHPLVTNGDSLKAIVEQVLSTPEGVGEEIEPQVWLESIYKPTPTIVEAAQALYASHKIEDISRSDSGAINLSRTSKAIMEIIHEARTEGHKSICFLTGVPGAGKTLAGLNLANSWHPYEEEEHAVFLSGNGPLVNVLREALARDEVERTKGSETEVRKSASKRKVEAFVQNIHHFRDESLRSDKAPIEKVVVFDEAQRAWDLAQAASFMKRKKGNDSFNLSEPEFLIGVMDRHPDWAVIICLIGGGQEINIGEGGLREWFDSLNRSYPAWKIHVSSKLTDHEYTQGQPLYDQDQPARVTANDDLHLSVSVRSYRSEKVAAFVKALLDLDTASARDLQNEVNLTYPVVLTRDLAQAKQWLRTKARGTERYGIVASSGGLRLKPCGLHVKGNTDPVNWFLNGKDDVRSSYYMEDIVTEFEIQGLELDWTCVAWDANLRHIGKSWQLRKFRGTSWQDVKNDANRMFLINSYRVLLTRARQGMVIFVPHGNVDDPSREPKFYDGTYNYLRKIGIPELAAV